MNTYVCICITKPTKPMVRSANRRKKRFTFARGVSPCTWGWIDQGCCISKGFGVCSTPRLIVRPRKRIGLAPKRTKTTSGKHCCLAQSPLKLKRDEQTRVKKNLGWRAIFTYASEPSKIKSRFYQTEGLTLSSILALLKYNTKTNIHAPIALQLIWRMLCILRALCEKHYIITWNGTLHWVTSDCLYIEK